MANPEHLDILKQGVDVWNQWRTHEHSDLWPNLSEADLRGLDLRGVEFSTTDLFRVDLAGANLRGASFDRADLDEADLSWASLVNTTFIQGLVGGANFTGADLAGADFVETDLSKANLTGANLFDTTFNGTFFNETDFSQAITWSTVFGNTDLRLVKGLQTIQHRGPSIISIETIYRSEGNIPEDFLRKAGVPDSFIDFMHSLVIKPIDYYTCFISYSSKDQAFADRLHADLRNSGVRCWFAPEDMKIGDKIRPRIDESIRFYDKLLLVLSEHSVASQWVEQEVETALEKERNEHRAMLFPIRLDNVVIEIETGWPALIRSTRHIGDFTKWKSHDDYQQAFERLLRDLKAEA